MTFCLNLLEIEWIVKQLIWYDRKAIHRPVVIAIKYCMTLWAACVPLDCQSRIFETCVYSIQKVHNPTNRVFCVDEKSWGWRVGGLKGRTCRGNKRHVIFNERLISVTEKPLLNCVKALSNFLKVRLNLYIAQH